MTRLQVSQGHQTWYHGFLLECYSNFVPKVFQIFDFKKCPDLEIRVRGHRVPLSMTVSDRHSRSLKELPFDRLGIGYGFLLLSLVTLYIEIFTFEKYRDLETGVRGN